jgi:hypothetical protein
MYNQIDMLPSPKCVLQWRIQGFFKVGGSTIKFGFQRGEGGVGVSTIVGFQKGVPLSKCVIFTLFCQNFLVKGGFQPPKTPTTTPPPPLDPPMY